MNLYCRACSHKFVSDSPRCPVCKKLNAVFPVSTVHFLIPDESGTIKSAYGQSSVACGDKTAPSATNNIHLTAAKECVTCEKCLEKIKANLPESEARPLSDEELQWHLANS